MNVEIQINNSANPTTRFVTWAPSPCRIRVTDPSGATTPTVNVGITGASLAGGSVVELSTTAALESTLLGCLARRTISQPLLRLAVVRSDQAPASEVRL